MLDYHRAWVSGETGDVNFDMNRHEIKHIELRPAYGFILALIRGVMLFCLEMKIRKIRLEEPFIIIIPTVGRTPHDHYKTTRSLHSDNGEKVARDYNGRIWIYETKACLPFTELCRVLLFFFREIMKHDITQ